MTRQFDVRKDDGSWWSMSYTASGVRWTPASVPDTPATSTSSTMGRVHVAPGVAGYLEAAGTIVSAAAEVGQWWEQRQHRLSVEAAQEQSQRIEWLVDMMGRWAEVHRVGGQFDLRVSGYLARETKALMDVVDTNKKVALPQTLMYELDLIQDSFRQMRMQLASQFEALATNSERPISEAVGSVLPGHGLNMDFVRRLASDPLASWVEVAKGNHKSEFDQEFSAAFKFPDSFRDHLFPSNEVAVREAVVPDDEGSLLKRLSGLVAGSISWWPWDDSKPISAERRETFRELLLLPAEFFRVRALHSAWVATSALVADATGEELSVLAGPDGVRLEQVPIRGELVSGPAHAQDTVALGSGNHVNSRSLGH